METIIGLEVHVQLVTRTKLFCGCRADYFAASPNTLTCPVCLGLPGALPVPNRRAVELALRIALALNADVQPQSLFERKNYFYPDLPKGYQITQHDRPLALGGYVAFTVDGEPRTVRLRQVHLEEDAGKLIHVPGGTLVDLNRCGVPLAEIVTEPDLRSPREAWAFLQTLRTLVRHLRASTGDMEKGALRCDANLSLTSGGQMGTRTEIKNLNSLRAVERALVAAAAHHRDHLSRGEAVVQATFGWDDQAERLVLQRTKEEAEDYRYFPDPDLAPLEVSGEWLDELRAGMPELPHARAERWARDYRLAARDADVLLGDPDLADYYEDVARSVPDPRDAAGWVLSELRQFWTREKPPISAENLAVLVREVQEGRISRTSGKEILARAATSGNSVRELLAARDLAPVSDEALRRLAEETLAENPQAVSDFRAGRPQALGFLVGQAMRKAGGRADAARLAQVLREILGLAGESTA
ncbi:MAG: Asp-tRNA(Asn)/Glu-tRNA(Gln) amidotransferase subunit GatB [Candidatus Bipolaricaulota bacterium]